MAKRILIVEDEPAINRALVLELSHEGYETDSALDGETGLARILAGGYDLVLLDIMLPGITGMEVLRRVRKAGLDVPVIMLTALGDSYDVVSGLDTGANDYITKPYDSAVLLARVRSAMRWNQTPDSYSIRGVTLTPESRRVTVNGTEVELSRKEFDLLECLMAHQGKVMSRDDLLETVWEYEYAGDTNNVDVYVRHLRAKIDGPFGIDLIETVRGVGYVIR